MGGNRPRQNAAERLADEVKKLEFGLPIPHWAALEFLGVKSGWTCGDVDDHVVDLLFAVNGLSDEQFLKRHLMLRSAQRSLVIQ